MYKNNIHLVPITVTCLCISPKSCVPHFFTVNCITYTIFPFMKNPHVGNSWCANLYFWNPSRVWRPQVNSPHWLIILNPCEWPQAPNVMLSVLIGTHCTYCRNGGRVGKQVLATGQTLNNNWFRFTCDTAWWRWAPTRSVLRSDVRRSTCTLSRRCLLRSRACRPAWPRRSYCACCSWPARSSICSSSGRTSRRSTGSWSSRSRPARTDSCLRIDGNHIKRRV